MPAVIRAEPHPVVLCNIGVRVEMNLESDWDDHHLQHAIEELYSNIPGCEKVDMQYHGYVYLEIDYDEWIGLGKDTYVEVLDHTLRCVEAVDQLYMAAKKRILSTNER